MPSSRADARRAGPRERRLVYHDACRFAAGCCRGGAGGAQTRRAAAT